MPCVDIVKNIVPSTPPNQREANVLVDPLDPEELAQALDLDVEPTQLARALLGLGEVELGETRVPTTLPTVHEKPERCDPTAKEQHALEHVGPDDRADTADERVRDRNAGNDRHNEREGRIRDEQHERDRGAVESHAAPERSTDEEEQRRRVLRQHTKALLEPTRRP